jgi:chromosome partitioning protein
VRTIAIVNQKGGCGKTTTAINLAAIYARRGLRTLLVDMDPQSHCAAGLGVPEARIEHTIGQALLADHSRGFDPATLVWEVNRNLWLAPSTMALAALEAPGGGLHALPDKDRRLESLLTAIAPHYDRCLIDCSPTVGLLTFNALRSCRETLIPVETGFFSLRGAEKQWNTIQRLIQRIGRPIACHMLATLHNPNSRLATNILNALRREFAGQILPVVIREHEAVREATSFGQPVMEYAPNSQAHRDFESLADWMEEHASRPSVHIEVMPGAAGLHTPFFPAPAPANNAFGSPNVLTPSISAASHAPPAAVQGPSRAAELARRVTDRLSRPRSAHTVAYSASVSFTSPAADLATPEACALSEGEARSLAGDVMTDASMAGTAPAPSQLQAAQLPADPSIKRVLGVRPTSRGMLFVQPLGEARSIAIAGEFNLWSADAHPMRRNDEAGVFERIIELPPGRHQYRLVIDGRWVADPHNPDRIHNTHGEPNSVVDVPG